MTLYLLIIAMLKFVDFNLPFSIIDNCLLNYRNYVRKSVYLKSMFLFKCVSLLILCFLNSCFSSLVLSYLFHDHAQINMMSD